MLPGANRRRANWPESSKAGIDQKRVGPKPQGTRVRHLCAAAPRCTAACRFPILEFISSFSVYLLPNLFHEILLKRLFSKPLSLPPRLPIRPVNKFSSTFSFSQFSPQFSSVRAPRRRRFERGKKARKRLRFPDTLFFTHSMLTERLFYKYISADVSLLFSFFFRFFIGCGFSLSPVCCIIFVIRRQLFSFSVPHRYITFFPCLQLLLLRSLATCYTVEYAVDAANRGQRSRARENQKSTNINIK